MSGYTRLRGVREGRSRSSRKPHPPPDRTEPERGPDPLDDASHTCSPATRIDHSIAPCRNSAIAQGEHMTKRKKILVLAVALAAAAPLVTASAATGDPFTCRSSLVRTENFPLAPLNVEPVVANPNNDPCQSENVAVIDALNPLILPGSLGSVRALFTQTDATNGGFAQ